MNANDLYQKLKKVKVDHPACSYTKEKCEQLAPLVSEILELKEKKGAIILAHSYVHSDIIYSVADFVGDSYELAKIAKNTTAKTILFPAVRFMAETAKILNPDKTVLDPNPLTRCSLAESIDEKQVLELKKKYADYTFVGYINTSAKVKALCDVCVTSANAYTIIASLPSRKIYFLPDALMGENIQNYLKQNKIDKELQFYHGNCHVHEEYEPGQIDRIRLTYPDAIVIAHPECKPSVIAKADVVGSTSQMIDRVKKSADAKKKFLLLTECGISTRLQIECKEAEIIGSCTLCKFMRSNSLQEILNTLKKPRQSQIVEIENETRKKALKALENMFYYSNQAKSF